MLILIQTKVEKFMQTDANRQIPEGIKSPFAAFVLFVRHSFYG